MTRGRNRKALSLTDLRSSESASTIKQDEECLLWDLEQSSQSHSSATINIINEPTFAASSMSSWVTSTSINAETTISIPRHHCFTTRIRSPFPTRAISKFSFGRVHKRPHGKRALSNVVQELRVTPTLLRCSSKNGRMICRGSFYVSNTSSMDQGEEYVVSVSSPSYAQASLYIAPVTRPRFYSSTILRSRSIRPTVIANFESVFEESEDRSVAENDIEALDLSSLTFDDFKSNFDTALGSFNELRIGINRNDLRSLESPQDQLRNKFSELPITETNSDHCAAIVSNLKISD